MVVVPVGVRGAAYARRVDGDLEQLSTRIAVDAARVVARVPDGHPVRVAIESFRVGEPLTASDGRRAAGVAAVWSPTADALAALAEALEEDPDAASGEFGTRFLESLGADPAL